MTQEELAERAGVTAKAISMLERGGRKRPYPHNIRSLADALGLSGGRGLHSWRRCPNAKPFGHRSSRPPSCRCHPPRWWAAGGMWRRLPVSCSYPRCGC
jgi:transcriptional regulator with XRE-family HTH domain